MIAAAVLNILFLAGEQNQGSNGKRYCQEQVMVSMFFSPPSHISTANII
jgi:hypothetical protein